MRYLWAVSLLWAFSFGLIGHHLRGVSDPWLATVRLGLAFLVLVPFFRPRGLTVGMWLRLAGLGAVQYGLMYRLYFRAFPSLPGQTYLIALFTVTTPIYVVLIDNLFQRRRSRGAWLSLLLAIGGAAVLKWPWGRETEWNAGFWTAFSLMQGSNLAFAFGQIGYRELKKRIGPREDASIFAPVFLGAVACAVVGLGASGSWGPGRELGAAAIVVLVVLGVFASGLGFLWWNKGATQVPAETLAVMNNLKIPLAVVVSLVVFQEYDKLRLYPFLGGSALLVGALLLARRHEQKAASD